jgi:hypothetical protein
VAVTSPFPVGEAPAQLGGREPQDLRDPRDVDLRGELGLRCPEAAERARRDRVGDGGPGPGPDVRAAVGARGVEHPARENHRRQCRVGARVHDDVDVLGHQAAVRRDAGPVVDNRCVALGRRGDVLVPVVDHPDRPAGGPREECRVDGQHGRVLFLAAEGAAGLRLDDPDLLDRQAECAPEGRVDEIGALERAGDRDPAIRGRGRDHRLRLDVDVLLGTHAVGPFHDQVGLGEARLQVALGDLVPGAGLRGCQHVEDRREWLGPQRDRRAGGVGGRRVGRRDQRDRLGVVADLVEDERRLIVMLDADQVLAGDVGRRDHHDPRPVEPGVPVDPQQARMGLRRADRQAEPRSIHAQVVGIPRGPGHLGRPVAPGHGPAHHGPHPGRCRMPDGSCRMPDGSLGRGSQDSARSHHPRTMNTGSAPVK